MVSERSRSPVGFRSVNTEPWGVLKHKLHPGAKARLKGLNVQRNDEIVVLQDFYPQTGRWRVRLKSGHLKDLKAEYLTFESPADIPPIPLEQPAQPRVQEEIPRVVESQPQSKPEGLHVGCEVRVHGLRSALTLNGQQGILEAFMQETKRWRVKLHDGSFKDLKADNLAAVEPQKDERQQEPMPLQETFSKTLLAEAAFLEAELGVGKADAAAEKPGASNAVDEHPAVDVKTDDRCGPGGRFLVREQLGDGSFSTVFRCRDMEVQGMEFAIKFTRNSRETRLALEREVKTVGKLFNVHGEKDPEAITCILSLAFFEGFEHQGCFAVAYELMKCNLRTALDKYGKGKGLPLLPTVRNFGRNIFLALRVLREAGLIHCDVKPENLLLTRDNESVKLGDFGIVMHLSERNCTDQMMPRHYRAPEVIMGQEYDTQIDMWSAGATLYELATDRVLFVGGTNNEMLHEMLKVCGAFTKAFCTSGKFAQKHFTANAEFLNSQGDLALNSTNPRVVPVNRFDPPRRPVAALLDEALKEPARGVAPERHQGLVGHLTDLLGRCLLPDPANRVPPGVALAHRFFQKGA